MFSEIRNSVLSENYANATLRVLFYFGNHRTFSLSANIKYVRMYLVRDIKQPNHESSSPQFFPRIFLSLSSWKRKQTFLLLLNNFGTMKSLFSFSSPQTTEKNSYKKLGTHNNFFDLAV